MPGATPQWREVACSEQDEELPDVFDENGNRIPSPLPVERTKLVPVPAVKADQPKPVVLDSQSKHHDVVVEATIVHMAFYNVDDANPPATSSNEPPPV